MTTLIAAISLYDWFRSPAGELTGAILAFTFVPLVVIWIWANW